MSDTVRREDRASAHGLADDIALRLQKALIDGEFQPGQALTQAELCARFGVSRTPVREALQKLHALHIIDLQANKGARVRMASKRQLHDAYQLRRELEGFAAYLACQNITDAQLADLKAENQRFVRERSWQPDQHTKFHDMIYASAGNAVLTQTATNLDGFYPRDHAWREIRESGRGGDVDVEDHEEIFEALKSRNPDAARSAMERHMTRAAETLFDWLERTGYLSSDQTEDDAAMTAGTR